MSKAPLSVSILINIILGVFLCRANLSPDIKTTEAGDYLVEQHGRFSIMRNRESPDDSFIVALDDGRYYWTIENDMLSLNVGIRESFSIFTDGAGKKIDRTLQEKFRDDGTTILVVDSNADGIPERRHFRTKDGRQDEIFFEGEFYPYDVVDGDRYFMAKENEEFEVIFDGARWVVQ